MNKEQRDLILAAEIAFLLHDLGKLHPGFAQEKIYSNDSNESKKHEGKCASKDRKSHIKEAHGAILEGERRPYPPHPSQEVDDLLQKLRTHSEWQRVLKVPGVRDTTHQAQGLGVAIYRHHAQDAMLDKPFLGDLLSCMGDIRDSALDKNATTAQRVDRAKITDAFGNPDQSYTSKGLQGLWEQAMKSIDQWLFDPGRKSWESLPETREGLFKALQAPFRQALGETRRPCNDVTLWDHGYSSASLAKAALAEGLLLGTFTHLLGEDGSLAVSIGRSRVRLLGVRWDWISLCRVVHQPAAFVALSGRRRQAVEELQRFFEVEQALGNLIYDDDDGAVFVLPGFFWKVDGGPQARREDADSEALFQEHVLKPLEQQLGTLLAPLGMGVAVRLAWTSPHYLPVGYQAVMGAPGALPLEGMKQYLGGEKLVQVDEARLRDLWKDDSGKKQLCPWCQLRPAHFPSGSLGSVGEDRLCDHCSSLTQPEERRKKSITIFGYAPDSFEFAKLNAASHNPRLALLSLQLDTLVIATGRALGGWMVRADETGNRSQEGDQYQQWMDSLRKGELPDVVEKKAQELTGDSYWLHPNNGCKDGRAEPAGSPAAALEVARECLLWEEQWPELCRHEGDRIRLHGMRKHASLGRLQRLWRDLDRLWKAEVMPSVVRATGGKVIPISLDHRGLRVVVGADRAREALQAMRQAADHRLSRVRFGLVPHLSAVIFKEKFPFYVAMDALHRLERRCVPEQTWGLLERPGGGQQTGSYELRWRTPQGEIRQMLRCDTGDSSQEDLWHLHVVLDQEQPGLNRLKPVRSLNGNEQVRVRPATFDFVVLDSTRRRYELVYDRQDGSRPHFALGGEGRRPFLWEQMDEVLNGLGQLASWTSSQRRQVYGQLVGCWEDWVRRAPITLRAEGKRAWCNHALALLRRSLPASALGRSRWPNALEQPPDDAPLRDLAGMLLDTFEWGDLVEKGEAVANPTAQLGPQPAAFQSATIAGEPHP